MWGQPGEVLVATELAGGRDLAHSLGYACYHGHASSTAVLSHCCLHESPPASHRVETEQGWKIKWDVFHHPPTKPAAEGEGEGEHHGFLHRLGDRLSSLQHSLGDRLHSLLPHFGHHEPAAAEQPQPPQQAPGSGGKARNQRMSVDVHPLPRSSLDTSLTRGPPRAGSLPSALDAAPLYELHHHHRAPIGIPETITEGALGA